MALGILLLLVAAFECAVRALYRWRTWHDRGIALAALTAAVLALFLFEPGAMVSRFLHEASRMPGGAVLVPAVGIVAGFAGLNPLPVAVLLGILHPNLDLSLLVTLPLAIGALPHTIFQMFTMPPRAED